MTLLKSIKGHSFFLITIICLVSCNNTDDDQVITEPAGSAEYFINNQTNTDIIIIFQRSEGLGSEIDTSNVIESNTSLKILEDGIIGVNPVPENSFDEIKFYESSDLNNPFSILSPVENEDWTITDEDIGTSGYGLTVYEIILKNEILN